MVYDPELARHAAQALGRSLLASPTANPKLAKGMKLGVLSAPLHLAPHKLSGINVCPMASAGCIAACLHTAGNPLHMRGKEKARIARTQLFYKYRNTFLAALAGEIAALERKAHKAGMMPAIRLNATSDIPWEAGIYSVMGAPNIMALFHDVIFYDYTKRANRRDLPANYSLTFSLAENNETSAAHAIKNGMNVAVVFRRDLPKRFKLGGKSYRVIDGDEHDFRPNDPRGVIVGLRAKGKAKRDASGFVREA